MIEINPKIVLSERINLYDYNNIKGLEKLCTNYDNISFKLELDYKINNLIKHGNGIENINEFMYYDDNNIIGYIGISDFGGEALEVNGMVHPEYRNKGIFKLLFSLVMDEFRKRNKEKMLILCDNKSLSGKEFINKLKNDYDHSEYDMVLNMNKIPSIINQTVNFRKANKNESRIIANMDSQCFDMNVEEDDFLIENIENGNTFIAAIENKDIGKVRIELNDGSGGIYGLGVLPEFRGKGYGRELLLFSINKLKKLGAHKIYLQVEVNNKNALNLYTSCGFEENYVMEYYKITK